MTHPDLDEPNRTPHPKRRSPPPDEPNRTRHNVIMNNITTSNSTMYTSMHALDACRLNIHEVHVNTKINKLKAKRTAQIY